MGDYVNAESIDEANILGTPEEYEQTVCEMGTIGWEGESGDYFHLGTEENGGVTLVEVQLYRGRDLADDAPRNPKRAQGTKIMARLPGAGGFWVIPKKGLQCFVIFPGGYNDAPGMAVIIATPGQNPSIQFSPTRAVLDVGPDIDFVIKARRLSFQTHTGHFIALTDEAGIQIVDKAGDGINIDDGSLTAFASGGGEDAQAVLSLTGDEANLMHKGGSFLSCQGANSTWSGTELSMAGASCAFGTMPTPATPVLLGMTGMAGVASTCMKGSP
jgi:hypothetical protein